MRIFYFQSMQIEDRTDSVGKASSIPFCHVVDRVCSVAIARVNSRANQVDNDGSVVYNREPLWPYVFFSYANESCILTSFFSESSLVHSRE